MAVDYAYEALALSTQTDMAQGRGELNAALKSIREQSPLRDADLAAEIDKRARGYRSLMPDAVLTPSALAKHWRRCEPAVMPTHQTNRSAAVTDCPTCGGDRFVLYALRPVKASQWMIEKKIAPAKGAKIEELAPCPDCNPKCDADWFHFDGTRHRTPDPAAVRERL